MQASSVSPSLSSVSLRSLSTSASSPGGALRAEGSEEDGRESVCGLSPDAPALAYQVLESRARPVRRDAPALLVVHGLLGSKRNMRSFAALLNSPKIVAVDLRNHGESPWRDSMRVSDLGHDLVHMLHSKPDLFSPPSSLSPLSSSLDSSGAVPRSAGDVVLIGHSLGGLAAMYAALQAPRHACGTGTECTRVKGLVVLDIAPADYSQSRHDAQPITSKQVVSILCDLPMSAFDDKLQLERTLGATDPPLPPAMVKWLMTAVKERREKKPASSPWRETGRPSRTADKTLKKDEKVALAWEMNLQAIKRMLQTKQLRWPSEDFGSRGASDGSVDSPDNETVEREATEGEASGGEGNAGGEKHTRAVFDGPVLFVKGANSQYVDLKRDWEAILRYFPRAKHRTVQNAGHWLHAEQPVQTAEFINEFLQQL
ncbi:hydrolase, alpha/beta fold family domain-containing protein [Neospora caninum Liverpool]|nr:hydrolase, alpha/beta fold family domain-containing protein [Neospora caninum Liverpool]CBZ51906.1 hydrolase, alpha/beta fold family domain-containing protein [Neospora caninum Liverpool]|eukprot:XP_003881939.1 hydrolase, alpha/beta fold family domain-containing protein [Neospora caninum Liverpool]